MAAATHDLTIEQGAYWSQLLVWKDETGTPIDLAGWTARMQVREQVNSPDTLVSLTTENGRITLNYGNDDGTILLELESDDTAALPATVYDNKFVYDLEMVPSPNKVVRLMKGKLKVSLEVTR